MVAFDLLVLLAALLILFALYRYTRLVLRLLGDKRPASQKPLPPGLAALTGQLAAQRRAVKAQLLPEPEGPAGDPGSEEEPEPHLAPTPPRRRSPLAG